MFESLCGRAIELGAPGAKPIDTGKIVFDLRSCLKWSFGCNRTMPPTPKPARKSARP
ncbi:MAG: hypothetical protein P4L55_13310 [Syntrophobacteraceae bacterium]|nr:hypothetical protein [Syntrophobacteraceae bacterium]